MKKRIRNQWNYDPAVDSNPESPVGMSLTVPDMSMSLKTLVERYTRSNQLGDVALLEPVYLGDEEVPHIERMTPQERLDYAGEIKRYIADARKQLIQKNKDIKALEAKAKEDIGKQSEGTEGNTTQEKSD